MKRGGNVSDKIRIGEDNVIKRQQNNEMTI